MRRIDQKAEKQKRNAEYAKRFRRSARRKKDPELKKRGGKYGNWCRIGGHAPQCVCQYEK